MRLPRIIRLDESDTQVYETAAAPGEWAVLGSFVFWDDAPETLAGKRQQAFSNGFLGVGSFGWSTLVEVVEADDKNYDDVVRVLAAHLVEHYGAPDVETAAPAAREEVDYAASICDHEPHTLLSVQREFSDEGIVESLRVVKPGAGDHSSVKIWSVEG
ncbi:MAG: DUF6505 family protein [Gammaproteobacteria bacterium]